MKQTKPLLITCLCLCMAATISAQQGNVAAGGDATGTGGSMSYSIGQADYLYYSSDQGSLSFGLQQSWLISEPPLTLDISDMIIVAGESLCFNALQTVTVAGDGDQFIVKPYGHADIIAGHNILLKHGTSVELHGSLHARISNVWCPPQQSLLASFFEEPEPILQSFETKQSSGFFKVYPNPTTGDFTFELLSVKEASMLLIEVYTMQGHLVLGKELPAERLHNLSIAGRQSGIYIVKGMNENQVGTAKIIKQ